MTTLFVIALSTALAYAVVSPLVTWCEKVKKEMREDEHCD